ncbi:MAG TPA: serine/threonine-protein kinase [Sphingomicrobium sp.]|nr:serine/threonine-protein kinase [Sphingomicrobium sp.]
MNKAYSNKALPMGTVLREWRIEEVLGVGGFGIVYKAQGIYFNELVAIKEYFPSSISERDSSDTVVPIDSDAEEVHALGLKKFVEEAKLLWNLSTPTRHPNIVSVRSLFEIHGTAYMVMDFEDGLSLSKMIKQGRRFNERSLWSILRPIAEGLERAHRVGVLHRDIKPPNILINEDNRPVLIDFGSARFDTAEATSTKVTFHTPPYAAIEQYVKTYAQGPWTDIYALGVVMYECVTGEKPPEVLERLHAGLGKPLAGGKWPGYSKRFLAAVDAAMIVKPEERPQSITDWLAMFGKKAGQTTDETDEDATRFYAQQVEAEEIVPVPPTPNGDQKASVETGVPADPKQARFKRAGEETGAGKKTAPEPVAAESDEAAPADRTKKGKGADAEAAPPAAKTGAKPADAAPQRKKPSMPVMAGAAVAVLAVVGLGGYMLSGGSRSDGNGTEAIGTAPDNNAATVASLDAVQSELGGGNVANTADAGAQPEAGQPDDQAVAIEALRAEKAKNAATEAKLAAIKKAAAKNSAAQAGTSTAASRTADRHSGAAEASTNSAGSEGAGVSQAKLSQFYSVVDDARSMAKKVMRSKNSQNAALAKSYDANLKTLRDSIRGVSSDREADRLIKQANQTRAYVKFLVTQQ